MVGAEMTTEGVLAFYRDCGVSEHLAPTPQDRFADALLDEKAPSAQIDASPPVPSAAPRAPASPAPPRKAQDAPPAGAPTQPSEDTEDARAAAVSAADLEALRATLDRFEGCALKSTAMRTCHGEGPLGAPLMFVGEAPGRDEDAAGRPFVGRSGKLLERMLAAIGFEREEVYISNVIPWRPPGNRTPSPQETATCEPFVRREIALVAPQILVPLGGAAAKVLLDTNQGIMRQRGRWTHYRADGYGGPDEIAAMAMFHPAYLLRTPAEKRRAWQDLLALRAKLDGAA
ncbi:MAG: uracil-DNA glycosylase [Pseudomonadota bacterium]